MAEPTRMEMTDLEVDRVDAVDRPANRMPFLLLKREGEPEQLWARPGPATEDAEHAAKRSWLRRAMGWLGLSAQDVTEDDNEKEDDVSQPDLAAGIISDPKAFLEVVGPEAAEALRKSLCGCAGERKEASEPEASPLELSRQLGELAAWMEDISGVQAEAAKASDLSEARDRLEELAKRIEEISGRLEALERRRGVSRVQAGQESASEARGSVFRGVLGPIPGRRA